MWLALQTLAFHLPLGIASWWCARHLLGVGSHLWRESFLLFCVGWRLETLLLNLTGNVDRVAVFLSHLLIMGTVLVGVPRRSERDRSARENHRVFFGGGILCLAFVAALLRIIYLPDPYDSLTYHLMLPLHWIQSCSLDLLATPFGDIALTYTPESVEGFFLALMLPTGSDFLARVGQLPFLLAAASLVAELTRLPRGAFGGAAALVFCLWPIVLLQGSSSMADVAAACYFLAAYHRLSVWEASKGSLDLVVCGAFLGLFLSSRFTSVVFGPILVALFLLRAGKPGRSWLWFGIATFLTGAYPYLRNLFLTGNPLYPLQVAVGDHVLFDGLFTRAATLQSRFHLDGWGEWWTLLFYGFRPLGLLWVGLGLAAPLIRRDRHVFRATLVATTFALLHFMLVPYNSNLRFLFPAWALWVIAAWRALGASRVGRAVAGIAGVGVAIDAFGWGIPLQLDRYPDLNVAFVIISGMTALVIGSLFPFALEVAGRRLLPGVRCGRRALAVLASLSAAFLAIAALGEAHAFRLRRLRLIESRDERYAPYAQGWHEIRQIQEPLRIAYAGLNLPYPLVGERGANRVLTIPLDGAPPAAPHESRKRLPHFSPSRTTVELTLGRERRLRDRVWWRQRVLEERVDLLAIYRPTPEQRVRGGAEDPIEFQWALRDPQHFRDLSKNALGSLALFRVLR